MEASTSLYFPFLSLKTINIFGSILYLKITIVFISFVSLLSFFFLRKLLMDLAPFSLYSSFSFFENY